MSDITPFSPLQKIVDHFHVSIDKMERFRMKGADTLQMDTEEKVGIKLRDLMARGIEKERLCWSKYSQTYFVVIRSA
jgi:hypothetical protein